MPGMEQAELFATRRGATSSGEFVGATPRQNRATQPAACRRLLRPESKMTICRDGGRLGFETKRGKKTKKTIAMVPSSKGGEDS
ncbi:hypothetical protein GWE18_10200 [Bradyrhizobium sp. CSA112]|uniref:hypothetical protein n=1 Tax=Bradyrhizobium sp. CSA112 TaxID=2699170 RepID=UPI0023AF3412|nr:hypothetical protein [Bradyrhizobium sp. CSA112]MDE5453232.1 hypothetical protein [Bradyrhizobium sp. CSA112]